MSSKPQREYARLNYVNNISAVLASSTLNVTLTTVNNNKDKIINCTEQFNYAFILSKEKCGHFVGHLHVADAKYRPGVLRPSSNVELVMCQTQCKWTKAIAWDHFHWVRHENVNIAHSMTVWKRDSVSVALSRPEKNMLLHWHERVLLSE